MQYRAAICDDIQFYLDEIKRHIDEFTEIEKKQIETKTYLDGLDLMMEVRKRKYDMIFLDVDMPKLNGIETAKQIREFDTDVVIIYITSHESFCLQAAQVEAMGYIVKPIDKEKLFRILRKTLILIQGIHEEKQKEKRFLDITVDYEKTVVDIVKIVYIQKCGNQLKIHMRDGKEYSYYETIKNIMTILPRNLYCKINGNMIVNLLFVKDIKAYSITLEFKDNTKEFPITRAFFQALKQEYLTFLKIGRRK